MLYFGKDNTFHKYLDKGYFNRPVRSLNDDDAFTLDDIRRLQKAMNLLVLEAIAITDVFKATGVNEIAYLANNMFSIVNSVRKQRDLVIAAKKTFMSVEPDKDEYTSLKREMSKIKTRMKYLRETVFPANFALTPIQDYLEIRGIRTMREDLLAHFGTNIGIFDASRNGGIQEYTKEIFRVVEEAGRQDNYRERLSKYVAMDTARREKYERIKKAEEISRKKNDAEACLNVFCRAFNSSVRTFSSSAKYHIMGNKVMSTVSKYGRDACVILCSYTFGNYSVCRYIDIQGEQVKSFNNAHIFRPADASAMLNQLSANNPTKAYAICQFE